MLQIMSANTQEKVGAEVTTRTGMMTTLADPGTETGQEMETGQGIRTMEMTKTVTRTRMTNRIRE
jgi:hypothetical protein